MNPEEELVAELAREVREAIRQAHPEASAVDSALLASDGSGVLRSVARAGAHLTPAIPEGARLVGLKRALLRALRFLWRDQSSFNAAILESLRAASGEFDRSRAEAARLASDLERSERRASVAGSRLSLLETRGPVGPARTDSPAQAALPPGVYALFEDRFRGDRSAVGEGQRFYLPLLAGAPGPVLDVGCGHGDFLRLLEGEGIPASGIEINPIAVASCRALGLAVEEGDALSLLAARPAASLGAIVAIQVVEHWPAGALFAFLVEARRAIAPGGTLVAETINTDSLSALRAFFLDPTHVRPVPPEALRFLAEAAGFPTPRIEYRSPLPDSDRLAEDSENETKLNRLLFAPQDYALVATVPIDSGRRSE